eukprot:CAMPEP_0172683072 /NCGR_PEP_ID=MMETSP1074-20121228/18596_1 /TAXON_ID=2916 /ORGANISM="Ceratium fusus, Strain PA161109" /LENGTH=387 /DNA_ID=CAMNT_0013501861 /DNA_START=44 /DNA_END=1207 /DNA_ORIENTATION=-
MSQYDLLELVNVPWSICRQLLPQSLTLSRESKQGQVQGLTQKQPFRFDVMFEAIFWYCLWMVIAPIMVFSIKDLLNNDELRFSYSFGFLGCSNFMTWALASVTILVAKMTGREGQLGITKVNVKWIHGWGLGVLQALEVGLGARMLELVSVTLRTEVRMLVPLFQYAGGLALGLERLQAQLVFCILVLAVGGCLAVTGSISPENASDGLPLLLIASGSLSISVTKWALCQHWLAPHGSAERPSALVMLCRMALTSSLCGFLAAAILEPDMYEGGLTALPQPGAVFGRLLMIGAIVLVMSSAEIRAVQLTSALTFAVLQPLHNLIVILADQLMGGGRPLSGLAWIGCLLCFLAAVKYAEERNASAKKQHMTAEPLLSAEAGGPSEPGK